MFIISFHGGSGHNNLHVYNANGQPADPDKLLAHGHGAPELDELRGFSFQPGGLYVLNGYKDDSQVLLYQPGSAGQYTFSGTVASPQTANAVDHPFDLAFDSAGNIYVTSQDTNLVTGLNLSGQPLGVASYLSETYTDGVFLPGTQVASSVPLLPPNSGDASPPTVPQPQGLAVTLDSGKPSHSVRGVMSIGACLLVADEPADAVKIYAATGELQGQITGNGLSAPVHLLMNGDLLYISSGNDVVYTCPLPGGAAPSGTIAPDEWITDHLHSPSGMCFDDSGDFYVALRKDQEVRRFDAQGNYIGKFITGLGDDPEFIVYNASLL